ncbi:MAG: hypothetical protein NTW56_03135 [Alphaproteobacteria bacterium]|nr:hypothetical protein [Alphaproteobacteria bacterium]
MNSVTLRAGKSGRLTSASGADCAITTGSSAAMGSILVVRLTSTAICVEGEV